LDEARVRQAHATAQLLITMAAAVLEVGFSEPDHEGQEWVDRVVEVAHFHAHHSEWRRGIPGLAFERIGEVLHVLAEGALSFRTFLGGG